MSLNEKNIVEARHLVNTGEWVPIELTPPLSKGVYLVTVDEYEHPFIAHFYPNNEPSLKDVGGYWQSGIYTLNDYGVLAWKPAPERYKLKEYIERRDTYGNKKIKGL